MIDFRAILREPVDLRGVPMPNPETKLTEWYAPSDLPDEKRDGKRGILFMDELNAANPEVQAACYGLVLDRKLADYRLPAGWRIIAAGNRQKDRSAAQKLQRALATRFAHIDVEPDTKTWIEDFGVHKSHPLVVGFMRWRPNLLHYTMHTDVDGVEQDERTLNTPRSWNWVSRLCDAPNYQEVKGLVGANVAGEFMSFVDTYTKLPDLDDVFAKPNKIAIPEEPSALFAISTALGRFADRGNFDAALTYATRCGPEWDVIVGLDATKRDPSLTKTKAYIEFTKRNKNIQIGRINPAS